MRFSKSTAAALAASLPLTFAQTFTDCNPTEKSCPNDTGLNQNAFTSNFLDGSSDSWTEAAYSTLNYGNQGAEFSISKQGQAPTIETDFTIFFGRVDVKMKAAKGTGIVSSIVFESKDLDEIDWEFVGSDQDHVQSNFFGKGNTTAYDRVLYLPVSNPMDEFHTYSVDWTSERIEWSIDGKAVRTLTYDDPLTVGGKNYPQTPMRIKLGNWCGGCDGQPKGTVDWSGGKTTFDDAPYVMYVESVNIQNYNPADAYEWSDRTGDWQSIKLIKDGSSSNPTGQGSASSVAPTQTVAPTASHSVGNVDQTEAAVSKTVTAPYGMGNSSGTAHATGNTVATSIVMATTQVPGAEPTGSGVLGGTSGGAGSPGASETSGSPTTQNSGSLNTAALSTSLLGVFFSFLLL